LDSALTPPALDVETVRAIELARLAEEADEKLLAADLDGARESYLNAMERAPRHPDLARIVAEIDASVEGRAEGALGVLVDSVAATQAGAVGAELLARVGDIVGAREAVASAAVGEPFGPVAALLWGKLAEFESPGVDRLNALDRAIARSPTLTRLRWWRLSERVQQRDLQGASADAEHLEAASRGAMQRHEACRRIARVFLDAEQIVQAGRWFERALRYVPDDPSATAGLARAFMESNRPQRAVTLLERAVALGDKRGEVDEEALMDLAKVLARQIRDLPAAVARLSQVTASSRRAVEARALEGKYRAQLGDVAGASLAYALMREAVELMRQPPQDVKRWLLEAARFEEDFQRDWLAAERHLALALRLAPRDEAVQRRYRRAARQVARRSDHDPEEPESG
jgi:tetratricopeptide (TPR) repeat protein